MAFYYSSSGGRTASSADVFGLELPYLQSRHDPWDTLSPYHRWKPRSFTAASLAQAFGLSAPVVDVQVVPTASGRPASVTLVKKTGESILLKAADVRARLGLRSTAFRIGVLRVAPPPAARAAGAPVVVSGLARDVDAPLLEKLGANGAWLPSVEARPGRGRLLRRHGTPEGHLDLPAHGRRRAGPGAHDHRSGGTAEVTSRASALLAAVVVVPRGRAGRACRALCGRRRAVRRPGRRRRSARATGARRGSRPRPDPRTRGLGARTPPPSAASRERGTSSRSAPGASRTSPTTRSCSGSGMPRRTASFDSWVEPPPLAAVRVAVIDSGIDGTHPELHGRIVAAKSFVAGSATVDTQGHGTFVAGLIAARDERRSRDRRPRALGAAPRREGRRAAALDPRRGRGQGDPVVGRQRGAGDQHEPRRPPRSRPTRPATRTRSSRPTPSRTPSRRASSSSRRSATATRRRRSRGRTRAGRRPSRTCSASAP